MRKIIISLLIFIFCWGAAMTVAAQETGSPDTIEVYRGEQTQHWPVIVNAPGYYVQPEAAMSKAQGAFLSVMVFFIFITLFAHFVVCCAANRNSGRMTCKALADIHNEIKGFKSVFVSGNEAAKGQGTA